MSTLPNQPQQATVTREQAEQFVLDLDRRYQAITPRLEAGERIVKCLAGLATPPTGTMDDLRDNALIFLISESLDRLKGAQRDIMAQLTAVRDGLARHGLLVTQAPAGSVPPFERPMPDFGRRK